MKQRMIYPALATVLLALALAGCQKKEAPPTPETAPAEAPAPQAAQPAPMQEAPAPAMAPPAESQPAEPAPGGTSAPPQK